MAHVDDGTPAMRASEGGMPPSAHSGSLNDLAVPHSQRATKETRLPRPQCSICRNGKRFGEERAHHMTLTYTEFFADQYPAHWQQARDFVEGRTARLPDLMHFEIHPVPPGQCFNDCIYCVGGLTPAPCDAVCLSAYTMIAACRDALSLGARQVVLSSNSGEPALAEGIPEVIEYLQKESEVRWGLHTCGRNLDGFLDVLTSVPEERGYMSIGLDAANDQAYQATKRPCCRYPGHREACQAVKEGVKALCRIKQKRRSGPFISISCQLTRKNSSESQLRELLAFAFGIPGVNQLRFSAPLPPTGCTPHAREAFVRRVCLPEDALHAAKSLILRLAERVRGSAGNPQLKIDLPSWCSADSTARRDYRCCANQLLFATLGPDSWVYPCTTVTATRLERRLVRFEREGDLRRFWQSEARKQRLWFDVAAACCGYDCTRCEHGVNRHFRLLPPAGFSLDEDRGIMTTASESCVPPCGGPNRHAQFARGAS